MDRTEFLQAVTLFFVAVIFLQTDSGGGSETLSTITAIVALLVVYLVPVYILGQGILAWVGD